MKDLGIYIHVPFCNARCAYCDFVSSVSSDDVKADYFMRLMRDIVLFYERKFAEGYTVTSVYFGGGTPSCVNAAHISHVLEELSGRLAFSSDAEITIEANPESFTEDKAAIYAAAGINRVSMGLQSATDSLLAKTGRLHTRSDFLKAADIAQKYFSNVSADIMLALPDQTERDVSEAVELLIERKFGHVSVYSLKVEERTPLAASGYAPDEDFAADLYSLARGMLTGRGYRGYEVSNFALPGRECRHNMRYWTRGEYIGFGASAHSFFRNERFAVTNDIRAYINGESITERRYIDPRGDEAAEETLMLALRTSDGLDISAYKDLFGRDMLAEKKNEIDMLSDSGFINVSDDRLRITDKGLYVMNEIIVRLLP